MADSRTVYYADTEARRPVPTTIEPLGDYDEAGRHVSTRTHFHTEREAWDQLIARAMSAVKINGSEVDRLRSAVNEAEHRLVDDALHLRAVLEGFEHWEREQEAGHGKS